MTTQEEYYNLVQRHADSKISSTRLARTLIDELWPGDWDTWWDLTPAIMVRARCRLSGFRILIAGDD